MQTGHQKVTGHGTHSNSDLDGLEDICTMDHLVGKLRKQSKSDAGQERGLLSRGFHRLPPTGTSPSVGFILYFVNVTGQSATVCSQFSALIALPYSNLPNLEKEVGYYSCFKVVQKATTSEQ